MRRLVVDRPMQRLDDLHTTSELLAEPLQQPLIESAVELHRRQARIRDYLRNLLGVPRIEDAHPLDSLRKMRRNRSNLWRRYLPFAIRKHEATRIRAKPRCQRGILEVRVPANFHPHRI